MDEVLIIFFARSQKGVIIEPTYKFCKTVKLKVTIFKNQAKIICNKKGKTQKSTFEFDYFAGAFLKKLEGMLEEKSEIKFDQIEIICTDEASQMTCRVANAIREGFLTEPCP